MSAPAQRSTMTAEVSLKTSQHVPKAWEKAASSRRTLFIDQTSLLSKQTSVTSPREPYVLQQQCQRDVRFLDFQLKSTISHNLEGANWPLLFFWSDCSVLLEKCPTMSPAKMFAYMKKREGRAGRQDPHPACNSIRDLFNTGQCCCLESSQFHPLVHLISFSMAYTVV